MNRVRIGAQPRNAFVSVTLMADEKAELLRRAEELGMTASTYMRRLFIASRAQDRAA